MKPGQVVQFRDPRGVVVSAVVVAVTGAGASDFKTLALRVRGCPIDADVPHWRDAATGSCWALADESMPALAAVEPISRAGRRRWAADATDET